MNIQVDARWFIFQNQKLLVKIDGNNTVTFPDTTELRTLGIEIEHPYALGIWGDEEFYTSDIKKETILPESFAFQELRGLISVLDEGTFTFAGKGYSLLYWHRTTQFCGRCGALNQDKSDERAKQCPSCGLVTYPRLSPAVIVAIVKDDQILLARNKKFAMKFYSVLSGFVEPGETLEECVQREIQEEVGIKVKNIQYFGSQPWAFPDSLMVGFVAWYDSGEIRVDQEEIIEAKWFTPESLPSLAAKSTIARKLIDWFQNERNK